MVAGDARVVTFADLRQWPGSVEHGSPVGDDVGMTGSMCCVDSAGALLAQQLSCGVMLQRRMVLD